MAVVSGTRMDHGSSSRGPEIDVFLGMRISILNTSLLVYRIAPVVVDAKALVRTSTGDSTASQLIELLRSQAWKS